MTTVEVNVRRSRRLPAAVEAVWPVLADVTRYRELVPKLVEYYEVDEGWHWVLEGEAPTGLIRPAFTVRYLFEPPDSGDEGTASVSFDSVETGPTDEALAQGSFELRALPDTTARTEGRSPSEARRRSIQALPDIASRVTVHLRLHADVPVPSLLAAPAKRFMIDELTGLADGFLVKLGDAVQMTGGGGLDQ